MPFDKVFTGSIPIHRQKQIDKLRDMDAVHSLHKILNGTVIRNFQTKAVALAYLSGKSICSLEMGLGKTLCALGFLQLHNYRDTMGKFLFITEPNLVYQTIARTKTFTDFNVLPVFGDKVNQEKLFRNHNVWEADGLVVSYTALSHTTHFTKRLIPHYRKFKSLVYDESLQLANHRTGIHQTLKYMLPLFDNKLFLTGTPIIDKMSQLTNQLNLLDSELHLNPYQLERQYGIYVDDKLEGFHSLDTLMGRLPYHIFNASRQFENEYDYDLHIVNMTNEQKRYYATTNYNTVLKTPDNEPTMKLKTSENPAFLKLMEIIKENAMNEKIIVYAWNRDVKQVMLNELEPYPFYTGIIDGAKSKLAKDQVQQEFNSSKNGVLITNIEEGLDVKAERMIFYQFPRNFYQMMSRGIRGVEKQRVAFDIIVYDETKEIDDLENKLTMREGVQNTFLDRNYEIIYQMKKQLYTYQSYRKEFGDMS